MASKKIKKRKPGGGRKPLPKGKKKVDFRMSFRVDPDIVKHFGNKAKALDGFYSVLNCHLASLRIIVDGNKNSP